MAWPFRNEEWTDLTRTRIELRALIEAIAETERVELLVHPECELPVFEGDVRVHRLPYGDSWTRDTAPVFGLDGDELVALCFEFNGWGGKYRLVGDEDLARRLATHLNLRAHEFDFVLEGGALEFDGEGTLLTTGCVALPNRTDEPSGMLERMGVALGVSTVLHIEGQLAYDHTDGHIDTLARFVRPGEVVCMRASGGDPNGAVLLAVEEQLRELVDAQGRRLCVRTVPSPGAVRGRDGGLLAASYMNYYLANGQLIVPTYGTAHDDEAMASLSALFPERRARGLSARWIVEGGGAFHCITQQIPLLDARQIRG